MKTLPLSKKSIWKQNPPKRIAVFRSLVLGDLLCTVPALRALRKNFPSSHITLVGLPWAKSFVKRFKGYFDDFVEFPGYPGLPESKADIELIPLFFQDMQRRRFDMALQMHGSGSFVNSIVMMFGARINAGFYEKEYCPDPEWFMPFPKHEHEINIYLKLMEFLDIPLDGTDIEFPLTAEDYREFDSIREVKELDNAPYVCIHAGARLLTRRWLSERFAQVANDLSDHFKVVLTGSAEEAGLVHEISRQIKHPHLNLAGKTTLGALGVLLKKSNLLISNDTGVSHVASALEVPSVVVVTGSNPKRWAPLNKNIHQTVFSYVPCRPCSYESCPFELRCARKVLAEDVVSRAGDLLKERKLA